MSGNWNSARKLHQINISKRWHSLDGGENDDNYCFEQSNLPGHISAQAMNDERSVRRENEMRWRKCDKLFKEEFQHLRSQLFSASVPSAFFINCI